MTDLREVWLSVHRELRREAHRGELTEETFQAIDAFGEALVTTFRQGCRTLASYSEQNIEVAEEWFSEYRRAEAVLRKSAFPPFSESDLNRLAAIHPFGFKAEVFGVSGASYTEAIRSVSEQVTKELRLEWPFKDEPVDLGDLGIFQPEHDLNRFVGLFGDVMERRPHWRNELWIEYDGCWRPVYLSEEMLDPEDVGLTPIPSESRDQALLEYLGNRTYRTPSGETWAVTDNEDTVLQSFIGAPALDSMSLARKSGLDRAVDILKALKKKPAFKALIHCPGTKGGGGYRVPVVSREQPGAST